MDMPPKINTTNAIYLYSPPNPRYICMDFVKIDDMHLLSGWLVFVGCAYILLEVNCRRPKNMD